MKKTKLSLTRRLMAIAIPALFATSLNAHAAVISVNLGNSGSTSEPGFSDWEIPDNQAGPHTTTIGGIDLAVSKVGTSNIRAIDRGGNDGYNNPDPRPLPELTRSWWGMQDSGDTVGSARLLLQVSGSDLGAGEFNWTSWHVDHEDQTGDMLVELSVDGGGSYSTASSSFDIVDGRDEDLFAGAPNPLTFSFLSNGTDDIIVRYSNLETEQSRDYVLVNGFEITAVPEPGTLALVGIALGGLLLFRRRK